MSPRGGKRAGAGRPKGAKAKDALVSLTVRVTPQQRACLQKVARDMGCSVSELLRRVLASNAILDAWEEWVKEVK